MIPKIDMNNIQSNMFCVVLNVFSPVFHEEHETEY